MSDLPDHLGDPLQRPQLGAKTPGAGAAQQIRRELVPASQGKPGLASRPSGALQGGGPAPPPSLKPTVSRGTTDAEAAHDLGLGMALREQASGLQAPDFQGREIPPGPQCLLHAPQSTTGGARNVTLLCKHH